jgi:5-methylcytosine-specific restriction protein A
MILGNFLGIDPLHDQPGLSRNNQLQSIVWDDFIGDLDCLHHIAQAIQSAEFDWVPQVDGEGYDEEVSFPEGHLLTRLHLTRERNRAAVAAKLNNALRKEGQIACETCGFDFLAYYGELGRGFAECHHLVPMSDALLGRNTRISDLAVVCANCHRMLHRGRPLPTIDAMRGIIAQAKQRQPGGVV